MKIAIDGFGGDNSPNEVIKGARQAADEYNLQIIITGDEKKLKSAFSELGISQNNIEIVHADGIIKVKDNPAEIRTSKAGTSMGTAFNLVKSGQADAFVSGGSTAALMVGGSMIIGRIKGVKRPALSPLMPSTTGNYILLDCGANLECRPEMLLQFGIMGSIYMEKITGTKKPRVALLNIGTEEEKGRELERAAYELLKSAPINFIGNAEARDVPMGICDVIITDGFTGNLFLKTVEGMGVFMKQSLKEIFGKNIASKIGYVLSKSGVNDVSKKADYREVGGSPLMGTSKPVIKAHGSSDARAFKNAINQAAEFAKSNAISIIEQTLK
jgi:glycerol-3-phosphate acyltransferase PlsX